MKNFICPNCQKEVNKEDTEFTTDIYGIPFRRVCRECYDKIMSKGYDGRDYRNDHCEEIEEIW